MDAIAVDAMPPPAQPRERGDIDMDDLGESIVAPGADAGAEARPRRRRSGARAKPRPDAPEPIGRTVHSTEAKSIVLFSDGTGNSSAKLFKTNVWRMYEAIDLGPSAPGKRDQVAYYDDGVGTSGFKPLAILGGVFGVGLKRNVLDIYQYACRNYRPGDHVYGFGFSRGAFTMRTAISLIADQGLVPYTDEAELKRRSRDAYRAYCAPGAPRYLGWMARGYRAARDRLSSGWRRLWGAQVYDKGRNHKPDIKFIGVWDTVSAYGGPIAEITRAIDNWFFAISMPNYKLNLEVQRARHALAIDDERDSFHPLLWDEVHERRLIERRERGDETLPPWIGEERLEQVWFTGMHADVGGGYPDESLSYVSLLWMIEEAEKAGLRTLDIVTARYRAMANSFGPMHDSRAGMGAYYRYQPRKIGAWLDPVRTDTLSLRDPAIADDSGPRGLVPEQDVKVHESVIARIQDGTDSYAPIVLPAHFRIVPPGSGGENQPQADSEAADEGPGCALRRSGRPLPLLSGETTRRFSDVELARDRSAAIERLWNLVLIRRITYFATVAATMALVSMPLWIDRAPAPLTLTRGMDFGLETLFVNDGRNWIGGVVRLLGQFLPSFLGGWIETYAVNPFYFVLLTAAIVLFMLLGKLLERRMHDRARAAWKGTIEGAPAGPAGASQPGGREGQPSLMQRIRTSSFYQRTIQITKWHVLPNVVVMPILLGLAGWIALLVATQIHLPNLERGEAFCGGVPGTGRPIFTTKTDFYTHSACTSVGGTVRKGRRYYVFMEVKSPWRDGTVAATPEGVAARDFEHILGYAGAPLRRVLDAGYMQPLIAIRHGNRLHIAPLTLTNAASDGDAGDASLAREFAGDFIAPENGELYLFVNDAVLPFESFARVFYERGGARNHGSACVTVTSGTGEGGEPPPTALCPDVGTQDPEAPPPEAAAEAPLPDFEPGP
jgi:uncharacterized protein (DUF2235 family)